MPDTLTWTMLAPLVPEIFLAISALLLLVLGAYRTADATRLVAFAGLAAFIIAAIITARMDWDHTIALSGMFVMDRFAAVMKLILLCGLTASLALSIRYNEQSGIDRPEFTVLMVLAGIGMMLMISAASMLTLYIGMELQSFSLYVLASFRRDHARSSEAGLKYFVLGALASGIMLFGISIIYGFTGAIAFSGIASAVGENSVPPMAVLFGLVFIMTGIAFKISAVPFHMWTPDVYEGAPTSVTAMFAIAPKIAAIALLMRVLFGPFGSIMGEWQQIVWFLSAASMVWSSFAALGQTNIKRLMAYSSIGNMGYALLGLMVADPGDAGATIVYMAIYMVMTAGVFAIILGMRRDNVEVETIADLSGLSRTRPALAYSMAILMFSMSGIPPLAGFFGKLVVFQAAINGGYFVLATIGVVMSVVAAYYYLKIIKVMFFDEAAGSFDLHMPVLRRLVLIASIAAVSLFIIKPAFLMDISHDAAAALTRHE